MKKNSWVSLIMITALLSVVFFSPVSSLAATKASLNRNKIIVGIGRDTKKPVQITVKNKIKGASYTFSSSDTSVVTVGKSNGTLTGKKSGKAIITVNQTLKKKVTKIGTCNVTVVATPKKSNGTSQKEKTTFRVGIKEKIELKNYFNYLNLSATYTAKSSDTSILAVAGTATEKNGFAITVKGKKSGTAKITITMTYKGKKKAIGVLSVQVKEQESATGSSIEALLNGPLDKIMERIYEGISTELPMTWNVEITKEKSAYYLGIENMEFEEALASEAMICSIPYSVCLVRVDKGSDVEAIKQEIATKVNPAKWICVGVDPENVLVGNIDNLILLVMSNTAPREIMNSFLSLKDSDSEVIEAIPDKNGLIQKGDYYSKEIGAYDEASVLRLAEKIDKISEKYLTDTMRAYYAIIPDKSYFIENTVFSKSDYIKMLKLLQNSVTKAHYIPILDTLELTDYYKTDLHWKQEAIFDTVNTIGREMNFKISEADFSKNILEPYQGIYAPYMKEPIPYETLTYLTNPNTEVAEVEIYGIKGKSKVYDLDKWNSKVPYDVFLSGPQPIVTITNPNAAEKRELIIFGDSFTNSFAPLLTGVYSTITLVDLRFVSSEYLTEWITFENQEVLFLYNTAVVNRSAMLK